MKDHADRDPGRSSKRRTAALGVLLLGAVGGSLWVQEGSGPDEPIPVPAIQRAEPGEAADQVENADADTDIEAEVFVRLPAGTVIRIGPAPDAEAVFHLPEESQLLVLQQAEGAFQVALDDSTITSGWARTSEAKLLRILSPALGGKPAVRADPAAIAAITRHMTGSVRELGIGPHDLVTDVTDQALLGSLDHLLTTLDAEYQARTGLTPQGEPRETLILFARRSDFRAFEQADTDVRAGYAGHAKAAEGLVVAHADRPRNEVLTTVVHEVTHLVNRRALGAPLPRWLSEGLADALGDSAEERGYAPLDGTRGVEGIVRRLRGAVENGKVGPVDELWARGRAFDQDPTAYDYERSALLVRYLLTDPVHAPRFRGFLADLAEGGRWSERRFLGTLGVDAEEFDLGFCRSLKESGPTRLPVAVPRG